MARLSKPCRVPAFSRISMFSECLYHSSVSRNDCEQRRVHWRQASVAYESLSTEHLSCALIKKEALTSRGLKVLD